MKKILTGTTALIAAGMISASAQASSPIALELGGYMDWWVGSSQQDSDFLKANSTSVNSFDVIGNGEVHFMGSTTLDSGVKIGVKVELEGGTRDEGDDIDESYVTVDTAYGRLIVGAENSAAYLMHVSAPDVGRLGFDETDLVDYIVAPAAVNGLNSTQLNSDSDSQKVTYVSPTYFGFSAGLSWVPGSDAAGMGGEDSSLLQDNFEEGYTLAVKYANEYQGIGITVSTGYANYNIGGKEHRDEYSIGSQVTYMGFTLGGAYRKVCDPQFDMGNNTGTARNAFVNGSVGGYTALVTNGVNDGYVWNLGASYETGPYGVSFGYQKSSVEGTVNPTRLAGGAADGSDPNESKDKISMYLLSGRANMGAGVDTFASFGYMDYDDELSNTANNNDGWAFVTGLALSF